MSVKIAGTAQPRTCNRALRVAIASELHLNTAANPHDNVSANHQHKAAAIKMTLLVVQMSLFQTNLIVKKYALN